MDDTPLTPNDEAKPFSATVINLDGVRIKWGRTRPGDGKKCEHRTLIYSTEEKRVWCEDCKRTIENWDALMTVIRHFQMMEQEARSKNRQADDALKHTARLRATKALDKAWSGNVYAVACPHCRGGLLPEDFANGARSMTSREIEIQRRKKAADRTRASEPESK